MLEELKQTPRTVVFGQVIFIITIIMFIISIASGGLSLTNYATLGLVAGCIIGVITSIMPEDKNWKFLVFDITTTAVLFISYVQVFSVR